MAAIHLRVPIFIVCSIALIVDIVMIYFITSTWAYRRQKIFKVRKPWLTYTVLWIFFTGILLDIVNILVFEFRDNHAINTTIFIFVNDCIQYGCICAYATRFVSSINHTNNHTQ